MAEVNLAKKRHYGWFRCDSCNSGWESSHVYYKDFKNGSFYEQECKKCDTACQPYKTEPITCRFCHQILCVCKDRDERHVDETKQHRSDLCTRCRAGLHCQSQF